MAFLEAMAVLSALTMAKNELMDKPRIRKDMQKEQEEKRKFLEKERRINLAMEAKAQELSPWLAKKSSGYASTPYVDSYIQPSNTADLMGYIGAGASIWDSIQKGEDRVNWLERQKASLDKQDQYLDWQMNGGKPKAAAKPVMTPASPYGNLNLGGGMNLNNYNQPAQNYTPGAW